MVNALSVCAMWCDAVRCGAGRVSSNFIARRRRPARIATSTAWREDRWFPDRPVCRLATRLVTIDRDNGIGATLGRLSPCRIASPVVSLSARARADVALNLILGVRVCVCARLCVVHKPGTGKETNDSGPRRFMRLALADSAVRFESASGNAGISLRLINRRPRVNGSSWELHGVARVCVLIRDDGKPGRTCWTRRQGDGGGTRGWEPR